MQDTPTESTSLPTGRWVSCAVRPSPTFLEHQGIHARLVELPTSTQNAVTVALTRRVHLPASCLPRGSAEAIADLRRRLQRAASGPRCSTDLNLATNGRRSETTLDAGVEPGPGRGCVSVRRPVENISLESAAASNVTATERQKKQGTWHQSRRQTRDALRP